MKSKVYRKFIKYSYESTGGCWGSGPTAYKAIEAWREEGGKTDEARAMLVFESELPFATGKVMEEVPSDKAGAWIDDLGQISWIRCKKLD